MSANSSLGTPILPRSAGEGGGEAINVGREERNRKVSERGKKSRSRKKEGRSNQGRQDLEHKRERTLSLEKARKKGEGNVGAGRRKRARKGGFGTRVQRGGEEKEEGPRDCKRRAVLQASPVVN